MPTRTRPGRDALSALVLPAALWVAGWVVVGASVAVAQGPPGSSGITVRLLPGEPVKEIAAREVLLVGSPVGPALEIAGQEDAATGATGRIVVCRLVVRKVDAQQIVAVNVETRALAAADVAAPNGLDVVVNPDLVLECGRGGTAVLALGVESAELGDLQPETTQGPTLAGATDGREGVRLDRIRILGPPGADGFIETLVLERSSVFGRIELRNLLVREIVLEAVTAQN